MHYPESEERPTLKNLRHCFFDLFQTCQFNLSQQFIVQNLLDFIHLSKGKNKIKLNIESLNTTFQPLKRLHIFKLNESTFLGSKTVQVNNRKLFIVYVENLLYHKYQ
jgi:hypothetical protein